MKNIGAIKQKPYFAGTFPARTVNPSESRGISFNI